MNCTPRGDSVMVSVPMQRGLDKGSELFVPFKTRGSGRGATCEECLVCAEMVPRSLIKDHIAHHKEVQGVPDSFSIPATAVPPLPNMSRGVGMGMAPPSKRIPMGGMTFGSSPSLGLHSPCGHSPCGPIPTLNGSGTLLGIPGGFVNPSMVAPMHAPAQAAMHYGMPMPFAGQSVGFPVALMSLYGHQLQQRQPLVTSSPHQPLLQSRMNHQPALMMPGISLGLPMDGGAMPRPGAAVKKEVPLPPLKGKAGKKSKPINFEDPAPENEALKCNECGKQCRSKKGLISHQKLHEPGATVHPCTIPSCESVFSTAFLLRDHMKKHSGHFKCPHCDKQFSSQSYLNNHLQYHKGEFFCQICDKHFSRGSYFRQHMARHSNKALFQCKYCLKQFSSGGYLAKHVARHEERGDPLPPPSSTSQ